MKRIVLVMVAGLLLSFSATAFQGGGGESTKKTRTQVKKTYVIKKIGTKSATSGNRSPQGKSPSSTPGSKSAAIGRPTKSAGPAPSASSLKSAAQLTIRSSPPNTLILIDGESAGETDEEGLLNFTSLKPGSHVISASKTGYKYATQEISLSAGPNDDLKIALPINTQALRVDSSPPEAEIYIDGTLRGITNVSGTLTLVDLPVGPHNVVVRKAGYRDAASSTSLSLNNIGQVYAKLEPLGGFLTVTTNVPNASIYIAGIGRFDRFANLVQCPPGIYMVTVSSPSYVTASREVTVTAGQVLQISLELAVDTQNSVVTVPHRADLELTPPPVTETPPTEKYAVPNGTILNGTLEGEISTKVMHNYDRFKLKIMSPIEFRGSIVEGYITGEGQPGRWPSGVTFNFDKITSRDGQISDFAATIESITDPNGKTVKIDNEGTMKAKSKAKEAAKRGGIGAGLGAILGGVIGGATGAAVGAAIGGSAGAGSAAAGPKNDIQLKKGSTISVRSSAPVRRN